MTIITTNPYWATVLPISFSPTSLWWPLVGFLFLPCTQSVSHIQTSWHKRKPSTKYCQNHWFHLLLELYVSIIYWQLPWPWKDFMILQSFTAFLEFELCFLSSDQSTSVFLNLKNTFFSSDLVNGTRNVLRTMGQNFITKTSINI